MPIISIACSKGGVGKSTIACCITVALQKLGYSVVLADCDNQFSSSGWADERDAQDKLEPINHIQKVGRIKPTILKLNQQYDFVIIDTGGHDASPEMRQSLSIADLVIIPLKPAQFDVNVIGDMTYLLEDAREVDNENLRSLFVLNMVNTASKSKKLAEVRKALKGFDGVNLYKGELYNRDSYVQATADGYGVTELKDRKAKVEVTKLVEHIVKLFKGKKYGYKCASKEKTKKVV